MESGITVQSETHIESIANSSKLTGWEQLLVSTFVLASNNTFQGGSRKEWNLRAKERDALDLSLGFFVPPLEYKLVVQEILVEGSEAPCKIINHF